MSNPSFYVHPTADVSPEAMIGSGTRIWSQAQVREYAHIGEQCNIGKGVYVGEQVQIGSRVKIQNYALIYEGVTLEDGAFVGPAVCFTNDLYPRAITVEGALKGGEDWEVTATLVRYGASIGAGSVIRCGVTIGEFALIGAGSVVTRDVPAYTLVFGNPARAQGFVCRCARKLSDVRRQEGQMVGWCEHCQTQIYV